MRRQERGFYPYLFDRALELGNDTVLIKISELKNGSKDIPDVTNAAKEQEFTLVQYNDSFLLYHREISTVFGTVCKYDGLAIGNAAASLTYSYPDITRGDSANLDDYTFAELSGYKVIYLSGFSYSDKTKAEKLVKRLSNAGVKIIISGDGIPQDAHTKERDFLGVSCQDIYFENGYPILYTARESWIRCCLIKKTHSGRRYILTDWIRRMVICMIQACVWTLQGQYITIISCLSV